MIVLGTGEVSNCTEIEINCKISDDHLMSFYSCSTVLQYWLTSIIASLFVVFLFKESQMKILFEKKLFSYYLLLDFFFFFGEAVS